MLLHAAEKEGAIFCFHLEVWYMRFVIALSAHFGGQTPVYGGFILSMYDMGPSSFLFSFFFFSAHTMTPTYLMEKGKGEREMQGPKGY